VPAHVEIERRLRLLPQTNCFVETLSDAQFSFYVRAVTDTYSLRDRQQQSGFSPEYLVERHNISPLDQGDVRRLFLALTRHADGIVVVLWANDHTAARMKYSCFSEHYDDLWYPASDDVWVVESSLQWLIEVDHEEIISYYRRAKHGLVEPAPID